MIQKSRAKGQPVFIVLRSHMALESSVQKAIAEVDALDVCPDNTVTIRVLIEEQNGY